MDRSHTVVSSVAAYMMCGSGLESFMSILKHDLVVSYDISIFSSIGTSIGKLTEAAPFYMFTKSMKVPLLVFTSRISFWFYW